MAKRSAKTEPVSIGVIGGSGLYEMEGLTRVRTVKVATPFGKPSDEYLIGTLFGRQVAFLPRHGRGHRIMPTDINYRANIYGMKKLGVERIISVSAVGSMKEEVKPGDIVVPDQFYDHTKHRRSTFFGNGVVAHVGMADPVGPGRRRRPGGRRRAPGRHVPLHGRAAVLLARRVAHLPYLECGRHRHDERHRGKACARGRDLLQHHRPGHGL
jgi:hypothetical protein